MSSRWSVLFYAPIYMLAVQGAAPAAAGSILIPTNIGFGLGGMLVGWFHVKRNGSFWMPSIISLFASGATIYALGWLGSPETPTSAFIIVIMLNGFATGATLNYTLAHLLHLSLKEHHFITMSLFATFRGFGGSFGTSIGGGVFYRYLRESLTKGFLALDGSDSLTPARQRLISRLLGTPNIVHDGSLSPAAQAVAINGYAGAIGGVWHAAAIATLIVLVAMAGTGWTSPTEKKPLTREELDEARARMEENEGVAEA